MRLEEESATGDVRRASCIWAGCGLSTLHLLRAPGRTRWVGTCARHETAVRAQLIGDAQRLADARPKEAAGLEDVGRLVGTRAEP